MITLPVSRVLLVFSYTLLTSGAGPVRASGTPEFLDTGKFPVQRVIIRIPEPPPPDMPPGRNAILSLLVKPFHAVDIPPGKIFIRWPDDMTLKSDGVISPDGVTYEGPILFPRTHTTKDFLENLHWKESVIQPAGLWDKSEVQYPLRSLEKVRRSIPHYEETVTGPQLTALPTDIFEFGPKCPAIDPARSLLITDLSVVNDCRRTWDAPTFRADGQPDLPAVGCPDGKWTFNYLITQIANEETTGVSPSALVQKWVETWKVDQALGESGVYPIQKRTENFEILAKRWPGLKEGRADPAKAPFRLEAIVNRIDLRDNLIFAPRDPSGGINLGELRFIFTLNPATHDESQFSMILEYGVTTPSLSGARDYARRWVELSSIPIDSEHYREKLESLTESVVRAGLGHHRPNRSALLQLRTHEAIHGVNRWQFRQWSIDAVTHHLVPSILPQTPSQQLHSSDALREYIAAEAADIARNVYELPEYFYPFQIPFRAAFDISLPGGDTFWRPAPGRPGGANFPDAAHILSLNTCSGCHGGECRIPRNADLFNHVQHRKRETASELSTFLTGTGEIPDLRYHAITRSFNDLERRSLDLARLYELHIPIPIREAFQRKLDMVH